MSASTASTSAPALPRKVRWGILGCGKISHDFVNAIFQSPNVELVACAARSLSDAESFSSTFKSANVNLKAYGSYAELVNDPNIEIIYIGTLHPQHAEHAKLCLTNGKHVLLEKPMCMNEREAKEIIEVSKKTGKFCAVAQWNMHIPVMKQIRQIIRDGTIGEVRVVEASFGFAMPGADIAPRLWKLEQGGGSLLDLGVYPISLAQMAFAASEKKTVVVPSKIVVTGELDQKEKIDSQEAIVLQYGFGQTAILHTSMLVTLPNTATITGTKGRITLHASFHTCQSATLHIFGEGEKGEKKIEKEEKATKEQEKLKFNYGNSQLLVHECEDANSNVVNGKTESSFHTLEESLQITRIIDEARRQLGVVYEADGKQ